MAWADEVRVFLAAAAGDAALSCALCALRKVENGRAGRELGVLSVSAPTLRDQARVAARSFRNHEKRVAPLVPRDPATGFYTPAFLASFSARWAPRGADNDPQDLNSHHARNLVTRYAAFTRAVLDALTRA